MADVKGQPKIPQKEFNFTESRFWQKESLRNKSGSQFFFSMLLNYS